MQFALSRGLAAILSILVATSANGMNVAPAGLHRQAVDESAYPWSAIGKLFNELGTECSGVVISRERILTAAHCLFNYKTGHFITPSTIHFLIGYRTGQYTVHARVASYQIGAGFDPTRYDQTSSADWAILKVTEALPYAIEPLGLSQSAVPRGTSAVLVGYPQDRAYAMTADRDCEVRDNIDAGRLVLHTCRGIQGYSGAPILVQDGDGHIKIAGIQIATAQYQSKKTMLAIPAYIIWRHATQQQTASATTKENPSLAN